MHIRGLTQPSSILRPADMSDADRPAHAMSTCTHQPIDMLAPPPHRATPPARTPNWSPPLSAWHRSWHASSAGCRTQSQPSLPPQTTPSGLSWRHPLQPLCVPRPGKGPWRITPTQNGLRLSSEECARASALGFGAPSTADRRQPTLHPRSSRALKSPPLSTSRLPEAS